MNCERKTFFLLVCVPLCALFLGSPLFAGGSKESEKPTVSGSEKSQTVTAGENSGQMRVVTDVTGRSVSIPLKVERPFAMTGIGSLYIYALAPEKLIAWNYAFKSGEKPYLLPSVYALPNLGGSGGTAVNFEELMRLKPDVIVMFQFQDPARAAEIERKTGVPVVIFDNSLKSVPDSLDMLGTILGVPERAATLSAYARETLSGVAIDEKDRISVYYAEDKDGLLTEPSGSDHAEVITAAGAKNAAEIPARMNMTAVSLEQIFLWNPQVIIAWGESHGGYATGIRTDPRWKDIAAVKNNRVYEIPNAPFNWVDRPYSVNRLLGVRWLRTLLYPDHFKEDLNSMARNFYRLFFWYDLTEQEAAVLLQNSR